MTRRKAVQKSKARNAAIKPDASATKRLARKWFDQVWNKKRAAHIDAVLAPTCIAHGKSADRGMLQQLELTSPPAGSRSL